jgi:hypothetical protein
MITDPIELNPINEPSYFKTASIAQCARQELCFHLTDLEGRPIDLGSREVIKGDICDECDEGKDASNPGFPDGIENKPLWPETKIVLRASPGYGMPLTFQIVGTVLDHEKGKVVFHLTEKNTRSIGVFIAEVMLYRGDLLLKRWPLYICVEPSLATGLGNSRRSRGGLTLPEIRLCLRDINKDYSEVLDEVEFKDAEILMAIQMPVDCWNDSLPYEPMLYEYTNFPYRHEWMRATCGFLLEMAAHWYRRNDIPMQAGGMTVQDRAKHLTYEPKSQELLEHYRMWVRQRKVAESMRFAWGTIGSTWPRG